MQTESDRVSKSGGTHGLTRWNRLLGTINVDLWTQNKKSAKLLKWRVGIGSAVVLYYPITTILGSRNVCHRTYLRIDFSGGSCQQMNSVHEMISDECANKIGLPCAKKSVYYTRKWANEAKWNFSRGLLLYVNQNQEIQLA